MALFGFLLKNVLKVNKILSAGISNPSVVQEKHLRQLLLKAQHTAFGQHYKFSDLLKSSDLISAYQKQVPVFEYDQMHEEWWCRQQTEEDITWPGKPDYFAISSGTTGRESKRIPVTNDMLSSIQKTGQKQIASLANFNVPAPLFDKQILMLGSATKLKANKGFLEGEITGISAGNLPKWFKSRYYKPAPAIAAIADWDTKAQLIAEQAKNWDIAAITGIPFWMILMLEKVIEYNNLTTIHDIWPNLTFYGTGGVAFEPYRKSINKLTAHPLHIMDTYLASEGFLAYNTRPETMAMQLAIDCGIFFEFIALDENGFDAAGNLVENPKVLTFASLEENKEYALLISTPAGAWRYMIGDTIKFTSLEKLEIIISGRTKYWLNVIGAQLTEEKINEALAQLCEEMSIHIEEYCVAAMVDENGDYYHQWILGTTDDFDSSFCAKRLDEILQYLNKNYSSSRSKVLKYVLVKSIPAAAFYDWLGADSEKGGQLKVPKVMKEDRMKNLMAFIKETGFEEVQKRA